MVMKMLVTGAGTGFGKGAAVEFAKRGHQVVAATHSQDQADALAAEHPDLTTMKLDVTNDDDVRAAAGLGIDVLINNAGILRSDTLSTVDFDIMLEQYRVNALGPLRALRALLADPDDTTQVFRLLRATSGRSFRRLYQRARRDPQGARTRPTNPVTRSGRRPRARSDCRSGR